jgi:hypothetical protein
MCCNYCTMGMSVFNFSVTERQDVRFYHHATGMSIFRSCHTEGVHPEVIADAKQGYAVT